MRLLPEGHIKYTESDVLDCLLYLQTIIGANRIDFHNSISAAWVKTDGQDSFKQRVINQFNGAAGGNMIWVPQYSIGEDGALYSQLQAQYIKNEAQSMPWLANMQGKGGGVDLMSIPAATDKEIKRPSYLPNYLPSLFVSQGLQNQQKAGFLTTKPTIRGGRSSGYQPYTVTAKDVAALMVYAQPVVALGPTPYPLNWYINDYVNGAMAMYYKISHQFSDGHTNAQMQDWGIAGDLMKLPTLDANPFASGFSQALEGVVKAVISYFTTKIPGGTTLTNAANVVQSLGGKGISGGQSVPPGTFTAAVYSEADKLVTRVSHGVTTNYIVMGIVALAALTYAYQEDYI